MSNLQYQFLYLFQLLLYSIFWLPLLNRRQNFLLRAVGCVSVLCGAIFLWSKAEQLLTVSNWITFSFPYAALLGLFGLSLHFCFDEQTDVILLFVLLPSTTEVCASALSDISFFLLRGEKSYFVLYECFSILFMCAACAFLKRFYASTYFYDTDTFRIINRLGYGVVLCVFFLNGFTREIADRFARLALIPAYRFLMSIFVFFLIFALLSLGKTRYQKNMTDALLKKQEQQYALARDLTELVSIKYHDIKHLGGSEQSQQLLQESSKGLDLYECVINCGNAALNAVLTEKSIACKKHQINFTIMADGALLDFMEQIDLYSLFGNLLDNAIDCLKQLPVEERQLKLRVTGIGAMVSVLCENACHDQLEFEDGLPKTNKTDKYNHGFGTKSVAHICKKYHAKFQMSCADEVFTTKILFPQNP